MGDESNNGQGSWAPNTSVSIRSNMMSKIMGRGDEGEPKPKKEVQSKVAEQLALLEQQLVEQPTENVPWVKTAKSDTIFGMVILLNALFIGIDLEVNDPNADGVNWGLWVVETLFLIVFLVEIFLRARAEMPRPHKFFMTGWGAFDTSVTVLGCVDTWVFTLLAGSSGNPLASFSVLRVFRLMRLVRLVRVLRMFSELVVLIQTLANSIKAVGWMSLLLSMILYTGSVICVLLLGQPYGDSDEDIDWFFGSLPRALYSHFCVVTLEGWPDIAMASINHSPVWAFYWIFMIVLTNFALVNLMVGVIVERIINLSQEQETQLSSFLAESEQFRSTLSTLFQAADVDSSGDITREEVRDVLRKRETHEIMSAFGINLNIPPKTLHTIMDLERDGSTSFEEFFDACIRLSGSKHNVHSLFVQHDVSHCHQELCARLEALEQTVSALPQVLPEAPGGISEGASASGSGSAKGLPLPTTSGNAADLPAHGGAHLPSIEVVDPAALHLQHQRANETAEAIQELRKRMMDFEEGQMQVLSGLDALKEQQEQQLAEEEALIRAAQQKQNQNHSEAVKITVPAQGRQIDSCCTINALWNQPGNRGSLPPRNH